MIRLDGETLTLEALGRIADGEPVALDAQAEEKVVRARRVVESILEKGEVVYGINTGFGNFASVVIEPQDMRQLQSNLIRSHAAGVGRRLDHRTCRAVMALRANALAKGHSGVRLVNLNALIDALNRGFHPNIPQQGSVGASGDLAPLAHLTLNLMGEGTAFSENQEIPAKRALERLGLTPIDLDAKEGLAFINGTQVMVAIGGLALVDAWSLARHADIIGALSLEALQGTRTAFDPRIHATRPHPGQLRAADNLWRLLGNSRIQASHRDCGKVQDSYSLRCMPQVHGATRDALTFATQVVETEINSATDNPMVFESTLLSGGNFHGEHPAMAFDFAAIGIAELANISERRIERLCNPALSDLPAFLVSHGGLHSGFMIAHCTAAALVSENKVLCHPASVDSISTSAAKEDHVSMGTIAARKFRKVVGHVRQVLAIELLAAAQGIRLLGAGDPAKALISVCRLTERTVPHWDQDRYMAQDIALAEQLIRSNQLLRTAEATCGPLA